MERTASAQTIRQMVLKALAETKITDIHTHLYPPNFGDMLLWGMDDLLTFHYLVSETMRASQIPYDKFWALSKREQADHVWKTLFVDHSPVSEAARGVLTTLQALGLDVSSRNLEEYRAFFAGTTLAEYVDLVFRTANLDSVVMTNDPFDDAERPFWLDKGNSDPRFKGALRLDSLLGGWSTSCPKLKSWGYAVDEQFGGGACAEVRRFLSEWNQRIDALYMAVSLPDSFAFPEDSARARLIQECVLPVAAESGIPVALMIGVKRQVNPLLRLAGDAVGKSDIDSVINLCSANPGVKFLVTMLSRENQHELCVSARKFRNLMIFGCWWFVNTPSVIDEITRMRFELLGTSFIPQHSDARVIDQCIYKWSHSRAIIGNVLAEKYADITATGWVVTEEEIRRDVKGLLGGSFWEFIGRE